VLTLGILVASFVIYAHRSNVQRLLRGEEHAFSRKKTEPTEENT
jgi:glycerol-3-phosphate acyltransferase PlsY